MGNTCSFFDASLPAQPSSSSIRYREICFSYGCGHGYHSIKSVPVLLWSFWSAELQFAYQFGKVDRRVWFLWWLQPLSIKICSGKIAAVVANDHTVDIEHRHNLEYEILSQGLGYDAVPEQEVYDVLNDVAAHSLARMDSCCEEYGSLLLVLRVADRQVVAAA